MSEESSSRTLRERLRDWFKPPIETTGDIQPVGQHHGPTEAYLPADEFENIYITHNEVQYHVVEKDGELALEVIDD